jgi:phenylalanine-4-hydroxylase
MKDINMMFSELAQYTRIMEEAATLPGWSVVRVGKLIQVRR